MLTQLRFSNFKSWAGQNHIDFGQITGLFGPNSSGKSAVLQPLLLLKQTAETGDENLVLNFGGSRSDYADFGSYIDLVHQRDPTRKLSLGVTWTGPDSAFRENMGSEYSLDIQLSASGLRPHERVRIDRLEYVLRDAGVIDYTSAPTVLSAFEVDIRIEVSRPKPTAQAYGVRCRSGNSPEIRLNPRRVYEPRGPLRIPPAALHDLHAAAGKAESSNDGSLSPQWLTFRLHFEPRQSLTDFLRRVYYLGPLREYPHRNYQWTGTLPATAGQRGELAIQLLLASQLGDRPAKKVGGSIEVPQQAENELRIADVQKWLHKLGVAGNIDLRRVGKGARIWELMVRPLNVAGYEANLTDVGFGVSQVLPVVVALLYAPRGSTVLLEHPEIHLHPKGPDGPCRLLDLRGQAARHSGSVRKSQ